VFQLVVELKTCSLVGSVLFLFGEVLGRHVCLFGLVEMKNLLSLQLIIEFGESCLRGRQTHFGLISGQ